MFRVTARVKLRERDDVLETLRAALELVAELAPPDELRPEAFRIAATMLGEQHAQLEAIQLNGPMMQIPRG